MKKSIAAIAASLVMITGLAPMAYAGPGNSDFGHSRQEAAHERRDARHEERRNRQEEPSTPDTPSTPEEPQTPDTPSTPEEPQTPEEPPTPDAPSTPEEPQTPDAPSTPEEPQTPDAPSTPGEPVAAPGAVSASGNSSVQNRRLSPAATTSTPTVTPTVSPLIEAQSSVIFLSAPKVVRQKQRMNVSAYCVLDGEKAVQQDVTFSIQRLTKGKNPRPTGDPRILGTRTTQAGEAEMSMRIRPKGKQKLSAGRYAVTVTIEMANGAEETATKYVRIKKAKKKK